MNAILFSETHGGVTFPRLRPVIEDVFYRIYKILSLFIEHRREAACFSFYSALQ